MRIAIHAEGPDDYVVLEEFVRHFLPNAQFVAPPIMGTGRESVFRNLNRTLLALAGRGSADLLVVCVDSDLEPLHAAGQTCSNERCPFCRLDHRARQVASEHPHMRFPDVAIGVAVPAIEAWLLFGRRSECTEAGWAQQGKRRTEETKRELKRILHGPGPVPSKTKHATLRLEARRVLGFDDLEAHFPVGLAPLLQKLRMYR